MCLCTPNIRTPYCGKEGCKWPERQVDPNGNILETMSAMRQKVADAYGLTPEQIGAAPKRELDKVIERIAWKIALEDGKCSEEVDMIIAMRLAFGRSRYLRIARAAYKALLEIDAEREKSWLNSPKG